MSDQRRLPPGPNVGTQLRALRAKERRQRAAGAAADVVEVHEVTGAEADIGLRSTSARRARGATTAPTGQLALPSADGWFAARGWQPFEFQRTVWQLIEAGRSGLLHATTGSGKTFAVWFGLLDLALCGAVRGGGLRLLWITPMRALSADTGKALAAPLADLGLDWTVGVRTGDTAGGERERQTRRWPEALVTTPESLTLLLARADSPEIFGGLALVVVDEWHELIAGKRGVQTQLALARLRRWYGERDSEQHDERTVASAAPDVRELPIWGLSATLGNLDEAMQTLLNHPRGVLVQGRIDKALQVDTLLPDDPGRFPWGGHLGIKMLEPVLREIAASGTTLVFTNTRSQAEIWYQSILAARPSWAGLIALHHGSLDREVRDWVEQGLKDGTLKAVVATSSLDLGVDFLPVERVLQIGSAKGVARLLQRAGRSGHAPGRVSRITLVPTNTLELIEAAAARKAAAAGKVESRSAPAAPMDVLVQHLVTIAAGTGFTPAALRAEVATAFSYRRLTDAEWTWALDFVVRGGESLTAYPEFHRVAPDADGVYRVSDRVIARRHRMSIGTIVAESSMQVRFANGKNLGTIEESFIARLRKGDTFLFGGRALELGRVHEMTAYVTPARGRALAVPRSAGGKMPLSSELADAVLAELELALAGRFDSDEMRLAAPLLQLQRRWSSLPTRRALVVEAIETREGHHLFAYPFAGRHAHSGLASLLAYRIGARLPATFSIAVNDYGFELLTVAAVDWRALWRQAHDPAVGILRDDGLVDDILASLNAGELAQRRFREIARIAGLVFPGFPGQPKSTRQVQASSSLFFEVLRRYDADSRLLGQAEREVLSQELEIDRLRATLARLRGRAVVFHGGRRPTPFGFPLMVERLREQLTTEQLAARIERMVAALERQAAVATPDADRADER